MADVISMAAWRLTLGHWRSLPAWRGSRVVVVVSLLKRIQGGAPLPDIYLERPAVPEGWLWCPKNRVGTPVRRFLIWCHEARCLCFPGGTSGKESRCQSRRHKRGCFDPRVGKIPWRRAPPPPIILPGKSHGQRSLMGYVRRAEDHCWDLARTACTQSLLLRLLSSPLWNGGIITRAYGVLVRTEDMLLSVQRWQWKLAFRTVFPSHYGGPGWNLLRPAPWFTVTAAPTPLISCHLYHPLPSVGPTAGEKAASEKRFGASWFLNPGTTGGRGDEAMQVKFNRTGTSESQSKAQLYERY